MEKVAGCIWLSPKLFDICTLGKGARLNEAHLGCESKLTKRPFSKFNPLRPERMQKQSTIRRECNIIMKQLWVGGKKLNLSID